MVYNMGAGILRAMGDSRRPMLFLMATCVLNVVLDLLFVAVLKMGVAGAALATTLSQFLSAVLPWRPARFFPVPVLSVFWPCTDRALPSAAALWTP